MKAFVIVESHGRAPEINERIFASRNSGVMKADIYVSLVYVGNSNKDQLLEELAEKYGLQVIATY